MRTSLVVACTVCFMVGAALGTVCENVLPFAVLCIALGGVLLLFPRTGVSLSFSSYAVTLCVIVFGTALLQGGLVMSNVRADVLRDSVGREVLLRGMIVTEPDVRERSVRLIVRLEDETLHDTGVRVLVIAPVHPKWDYGDRVSLRGVLERPENFVSDETGREFDYVGYLAKDGVHYEMYHPDMTLVGHNTGHPIVAAALSAKSAFLNNLSRSMHEPYAALAGGLIVGAKQSLGEELLDDFRAVGLVHVVVLSGYNVTIVALVLMKILSFFSLRVRALAAIGAIVLFAIMTGAGATIVRASIMAALVIVGKTIGRPVDMLRLLALAVFAMVALDPLIVVYDPSFQLSVLATLGLIIFSSPIEERLMFVTERFGLREILAATVATQIVVLPLLMYMTGNVSVISLVANILVVPIIPVTMLLCFCAGVAGFAGGAFAAFFAWAAFMPLYYEVTIVEILSSVPYAQISVPFVSFPAVVVAYGILALCAWKAFGRTRLKS